MYYKNSKRKPTKDDLSSVPTVLIVLYNTNSKCSAESFYYAVYYKLADVLPGKPWGEHRFYPQ